MDESHEPVQQQQNPPLYTCALCNSHLFFDEIAAHPCMTGFTSICILEGTSLFYPQSLDGVTIDTLEKLKQHNRKDIADGNKENNISNQNVEANECQGLQNTLTDNNSSSEYISMEELLIAAVQERPPLWNYKDCPPSQRTNAAKNKLWEEIESTINPNKDPKYNIIYFKNKWKNLWDTYRGYLAKEKTRSGQAAKPKKPWRFMDQMSFLRDTFDAGIKRTANNLSTDTPDNIPESDSESLDTSTDKPTTKKQKTDDAIDKIAAALAMPIQMPQINLPSLPIAADTNKDEINHFCAALDEKLHKLDTKKASLAMFRVYEVLFKIENDLNT